MIFSCTNKSILSVTLSKEFKQIFYFGLKSIGIYSHTIWIPILERSHFPKSPPRCPSVCLVLFVMTPQKTSNRIVHLNAAKNTEFYGVRHHLTLQKCLSPSLQWTPKVWNQKVTTNTFQTQIPGVKLDKWHRMNQLWQRRYQCDTAPRGVCNIYIAW